jgi:hypothetical protein
VGVRFHGDVESSILGKGGRGLLTIFAMSGNLLAG